MGNGGDYRARVVWEDGLSEKVLEDWPECIFLSGRRWCRPRLVVMGALRKQTERARRAQAGKHPPWPLPQLLHPGSCLKFLSDFSGDGLPASCKGK